MKGQIEEIDTELFKRIIAAYRDGGWQETFAYGTPGSDSEDFAEVRLKQGEATLGFKWNRWFEGEIRGPEKEMRRIAKQYDLDVQPLENDDDDEFFNMGEDKDKYYRLGDLKDDFGS